jgi:LAGLIDADG-like domain
VSGSAAPAGPEQRHHNQPPPEFLIEYERPYLYPKQFDAIFDEHRYSIIEASAQPLDSVVQTPNGPRRFGSLRVGDQIFSVDGSVTKVTGVFPKGVQAVYEIRFLDGAVTRASGDHLWRVRHPRDGEKVLTTDKIRSFTKKSRALLKFPVAAAVEYPRKPVAIDPWLLGVLIGDGSLCGNAISFSTADPEIVARVRSSLPSGYEVRAGGSYSYRIVARSRGAGYEKPSIRYKANGYEVSVGQRYVGRASTLDAALEIHKTAMRAAYGDDLPEINLRQELRALGLLGLKHNEKFVPEIYLRNSIEVRLEVLRGLMDTDGSAGRGRGAVIEQTSERLAHQIVELARSLGGVGRIAIHEPKNAKWKRSYRVNIRHDDVASFFWLPRKKIREALTGRYKKIERTISEIVRLPDAEVQCISVAHKSKLYLTDDYIVTHNTKAGKAQPLDALVYTPSGPKRMGDIRVGDKVLAPGGCGNVIGVYPQGEREILRVTFSDGQIVEADAQHLWEVHQFNQKSVVVTTEQLQAWPSSKLHRAWVPKADVAAFEMRPVPLDPYLVGALIGDGGLTGESVMFSNEDSEILDAVRAAIPSGHMLKHRSHHDWCISGGAGAAQLREDGTHIQRALRDLGLAGKGSHEKVIPDCYRYNSENVRISVLQGVLDTDGFVDKHGQPGIEQTSQRLAQDIEEIVQSLGGTVLTRLREVNGYRAKDGRFVPCKPVWRQVIRMEDGSQLFRLRRKRDACRPKLKTGNRMFRSIEFARRAQAQCIQLDTARQLYLTNGFVPTHNTAGCITWLVEKALGGQAGHNYWWVAPVSDQALIAFNRMRRALPQDVYSTNISLKTITLLNGAVIWFKSGDKPNSLYGEDVYAAVIDEASRFKEEAYIAIRSTLTYTRGPVRIIGNVRGRKNWFFKMARRAERDGLLGIKGEMGYHKITAADAVAAGVLDAQEIEDARGQMPEQWFRELYWAEPSDDGGNPFGMQHIEACIRPETVRGSGVVSTKKPVAWGFDFAKKRDYFVAIGLDEDGAICRFERFHHVAWGEIINKVVALTGGTPALGDSTGVGDPIVEDIQRKLGYDPNFDVSGCQFQGYNFTQASKQRLMEGLAVAIQTRAVWFADNVVRQELEQFEFEFTRSGIRYSAPEGYFDDCVCALALARMCQATMPQPVRVNPNLLKQIAALPRRRAH